MARYIGPVCRLCRREGMKLFLKGERCHTREVRHREAQLPARRSTARRRKAKLVGLRRAAAREAEGASASTACSKASSAATSRRRERQAGITGETLLQLLERRLDNVVYRLGFATSRAAGAPAGAPRPLHGQRPQGRHPVVLGEAGRRGGAARERASKMPARRARARRRSTAAACRMDVVRPERIRGQDQLDPDPRARSSCRCRNS